MTRKQGKITLKKYTKYADFIEEQLDNYVKNYMLINSIDENYYDNIYNCKLNELVKGFTIGDLENRINNKIILKEDIVSLSPSQLIPEKWEKIIYKQNLLKEKQENMATSDIYECDVCHKRRCIVTQAQIRSADEPMTTFFKCVECGHTTCFE
jgi:DNA-directed RNA polymerase subunit M/transcription elongation factor TFIIS